MFDPPANPMLPMWAVLPLVGVAIAVIVVHLALVWRSSMPWSRKRIRGASGIVLMGLSVLLGYALGCVESLPSGGGSIAHIREFVVAWMAIMGLVPVVLGLAAMDVLNTVRLQREAARRARVQRRIDMLREVEIRVRARLGAGGQVSQAGIAGAGRGVGGMGAGGVADDANDR